MSNAKAATQIQAMDAQARERQHKQRIAELEAENEDLRRQLNAGNVAVLGPDETPEVDPDKATVETTPESVA